MIVRITALFLLLLSVLLKAGTTGKISGQVSDAQTGEALIGVNIVVEGSSLGASTDEDGFFVIINIPPGKKTIAAYYVGYRTTKVADIHVSADRTAKVNIGMQTEVAAAEEILVVADRPPVEIDRTHTAAIINSETFDKMPVTSLKEVVALQSGVVSSGGELHFRGGRAREVAYLIDGIPVQNAYSQSGGYNVNVENNMIEELEVISGTFNAEYGSAQSGVVNIITKGIANKIKGGLQTYSGEWMSRHNDIYLGVDDVNPFAEKDIQFHLSGPIIPGKLGFFISGRHNNYESLSWYERRFNPQDGWVIAAYRQWYQEHNNEDANNSLAINIPDSLITGDGTRGPAVTGHNSNLTLKLNWQIAPALGLAYQVFGSYGERKGSASTYRRYQPDGTGKRKNVAHSHFVTLKHAPTQSFFYNIGVSYQFNDSESFYDKSNRVALSPGAPGIQPISASSSGFSLGDTDGFYTDKKGKNQRELFLINGDVNWQIDRYNFIKAGFIYKQHRINDYYNGFIQTDFWKNNKFILNAGKTMDWDAYLAAHKAYWASLKKEQLYQADDKNFIDYTIEPAELAFYIQDKLELGDIIINAGLRYDMFIPNENYPVQDRTESYNLGVASNLKKAEAKKQLSPRIGISFPISSNGAFHAAYGHFFQMPSLELMFKKPLKSYNSYLDLNNEVLGQANLAAEKTIGNEIGLQQEVAYGISVDITAYYKDFRNLIGLEILRTIDNAQYKRYTNRDYGNTKGITIGVAKGGGDISGGLNYTYAFANGSYSDPNTIITVEGASSINGEEELFIERKVLPLDWDQTHTLNSYINYSQPSWSMGFVGFVSSGLPYSPSFWERNKNPQPPADREYRNSDSKPLKWNVDFKARKSFDLGSYALNLFLKIDNIFDQLNQENVFSSTGSADELARLPEQRVLDERTIEQEGLFTLQEIDLRPGFYSSPRKIQLGMEITF